MPHACWRARVSFAGLSPSARGGTLGLREGEHEMAANLFDLAGKSGLVTGDLEGAIVYPGERRGALSYRRYVGDPR